MHLLPLVIGVVVSLAAPGGGSSTASHARLHRALMKPDRHVRTEHPRVTAALFEGVRRSRTFASLIDALDRSDVIAYVQLVHDLPRASRGRLLLASKTNGQRYVRIQMLPFLPHDDMIAVLGHELRHAVEIAEAPEIHDEASFRRFYQRAGAGISDGFGFDTEAARIAGDRVKRELREMS